MDIQWIARILVRDLEAVKREIAAFPDDESVWAVVPGITNSAGTLALHLTGNLRHFVGSVLGRSGYVRNRDQEFAARGLSRDALLGELDLAAVAVRSTLAPGQPIDFAAEYPEMVGGGFRVATGDWLIHLATHLTFHLGQVGYLRRTVTGNPTSVGALSIPQLASAVKVPKPSV
jgi:hypothetical protein